MSRPIIYRFLFQMKNDESLLTLLLVKIRPIRILFTRMYPFPLFLYFRFSFRMYIQIRKLNIFCKNSFPSKYSIYISTVMRIRSYIWYFAENFTLAPPVGICGALSITNIFFKYSHCITHIFVLIHRQILCKYLFP